MSFLALVKENKESLSISDKLFKEENIKYVSMSMLELGFSEGRDFYWIGKIEFVVESTKGIKEFKVKGKNSMVALVKEMEDFVKTL